MRSCILNNNLIFAIIIFIIIPFASVGQKLTEEKAGWMLDLIMEEVTFAIKQVAEGNNTIIYEDRTLTIQSYIDIICKKFFRPNATVVVSYVDQYDNEKKKPYETPDAYFLHYQILPYDSINIDFIDTPTWFLIKNKSITYDSSKSSENVLFYTASRTFTQKFTGYEKGEFKYGDITIKRVDFEIETRGGTSEAWISYIEVLDSENILINQMGQDERD